MGKGLSRSDSAAAYQHGSNGILWDCSRLRNAILFIRCHYCYGVT